MELVNALCTKRVDEEVCAERAFLQELNGGCHTPLGARCILHEADAELFAVYGSEDGTRLFDLHVSGPRAQAQAIATEAAQRLRKKWRKVYDLSYRSRLRQLGAADTACDADDSKSGLHFV